MIAILVSQVLAGAPGEGTTSSGGTWLAPGVEELPGLPMGPFVRLGDGSILTVDTASSAMVSNDDGKTWESRPVFADTAKYAIRPERAILRTPAGVIILAFANDKERANWRWDKEISDSPGARLPTYAVRSPDDGKTWDVPQKLHDDWTGAIRDMIQTKDDTVVFTSMMMQHDPGRHSVVTYSSPDDGKAWTDPGVVARNKKGWIAYPYLFEASPGELWVTTMQGGLRARLHEEDFIGK
jgi:hypothetical protein